MDAGSSENGGTRQQRRERKLRKKRERMAKHGRSLADMYRQAILKRLRRRRGREH